MGAEDLDPKLESAETVVGEPTEPSPGAPDALPAGSKIGRYVLLGELGHGGMGTVYKAFDPELDRPVALKIVRVATGDTDTTTGGRARLAREAQAIAKVSHPNVVSVHDVGVAGHNVFIAMEFVDGVNLRAWARARERSWREVVELFVAAGRGLAAAHEAGLIHRDFKPENVLVGPDGRPRVLDFGLVRAVDEDVTAETLPPGTRRLPRETASSLNTPLTRAGEIMGTVGYMAPEQYLGKETDEKSDQFSFCVSLYEGLYGVRPFKAKTVAEIKDKVLHGRVDDPPPHVRVPARVHQLVLRGLETDRANRHGSMHGLLQALDRAAGAGARRGTYAAIAAAALAATVLGVAGLGTGDRDPPCQGGDRHLAGVWDDATRRAVGAAFERAPGAHSRATRSRVEHDLDRYRDAWIAKRNEVCAATRVYGDQSEAAMDLRAHCLDRQLGEVRALATVLAEGDDKTLSRAAIATGRLPDPSDCDDVATLGAIAPPPEADRPRVAEIEAQLARAKALSDAGKIADARALVEPALAGAKNVGYEPLIARAVFARGVLDRLEYKGEEARASIFDAMVRADDVADDVLRADARIELVFIDGYLLRKPEVGLAHGEQGAALVSRLGDRPRLEGQLLSNIGVIHQDQARYREAADHFAASLTLRERVYGPNSFELISALNNLGSALNELGRNDEAKRHLERAIAILEELFGKTHPHLAAVLVNLGLAVNDLGEYEAAIAHFERAAAIYEEVFGPDHRAVVPALNNLADVLADIGEYERAFEVYERSMGIRETSYGPEHALTALTLLGYGSALSDAGQYARATEKLERARAIWTKAYGEEHADVARALHALGVNQRRRGRLRDARRLLARALAIQEATLGDRHTALVPVLSELGQLEIDANRPGDAVPVLERAIAIADANSAPEPGVAIARFALARAMWRSDRDRGRARRLAEHARTVFAERGKPTASYLAATDEWLAAHR